MQALTFKRNADGEMEAWDEQGRTTLQLTFGECVEMLRWHFDDVPPIYRMATRDDWPLLHLERWQARHPTGAAPGRGGDAKNFADPPPTDRPPSKY